MRVTRPIPGYPGYLATDDGRILSTRLGRPKPLCLRVGTRGYLMTNVRRGIGRKTVATVDVHRLVLLAFRGLPRVNQEARHLDGNCLNNAISNLCWGSHSENMGDQIRHGTLAALRTGENSPGAKLSNADVVEIRLLRKAGWTQFLIARQFGVSQRHVSMICHGEIRTRDGVRGGKSFQPTPEHRGGQVSSHDVSKRIRGSGAAKGNSDE